MARAPRFVDIHIVQPVPYANLNRDDTNSVKTVLYGDALRTRVSSQSWKRATRLKFQHLIGENALRTRRVGERITWHLKERGWDQEPAERAGAHVAAASSIKFEMAKEDDGKTVIPNKVFTNALAYLPEEGIRKLADLAEAHKDTLLKAKPITKDGDKGDKSALLKYRSDVDEVFRSRNAVIQLFGRMLAEVDQAGVDGAVQVAHAFTTHTTEVELDYFAAVDDVTDQKRDVTGSGHMGTAEYSAGTFYRYATVDLDGLRGNLKNDEAAVTDLLRAFLEAFVQSLPAAKKNSTAAHTLAHLVHVAVRADRPVSFAGAFEAPVLAAERGGFVQPSVTALDEYAAAANGFLGMDRLLHAGHTSFEFDKLEHLGARHTSLDSLIEGAIVAVHPGGATA